MLQNSVNTDVSNPQYVDKSDPRRKMALTGVLLIDDAIVAAVLVGFLVSRGLGKRINKIVGNQPGPMKAWVEEALKSDFKAGNSYLPRTNLSYQLLLEHKRRSPPNTLVYQTASEAFEALSGLKMPSSYVRAVNSIGIGGAGFGAKQVNIINKLWGKRISKHLPDWSKIVKSGSGLSLIFTKRPSFFEITTTITTYDRATGKELSKKILSTEEKPVISREILTHELFHRVSQKHYKSYTKHGSSKDLKKYLSGLTFPEEYLASGKAPDEIVAYALTKRVSGGGRSLIGGIISARMKSHPFWGQLLDPKSGRLSYLKMKGYLGEKVGAKSYYKELANAQSTTSQASAISNIVKDHIPTWNKTQGLVNNVLNKYKTMHKVASQRMKSSVMWKLMRRR